MEAEDLKLTVDEIQGFSKIFLASFEGGNFTYTDEVYNILGVSPEEHPPETLFDFMIPEDKERFYKLVTELSPENPTHHYIYLFTQYVRLSHSTKNSDWFELIMDEKAKSGQEKEKASSDAEEDLISMVE